MTDSKDKSRLSEPINKESSKEELAKFENSGTSRDWKNERNRKAPDADNRRKEKTPPRDRDTHRYEDRHKNEMREREKLPERDRPRQRSPPRRAHPSPPRSARPPPRDADRERDYRRERPREREERGREERRELPRPWDRPGGRRSMERAYRNESRYEKDVNRSRPSPPSRGREGYAGGDVSERKDEAWRRDRNRDSSSSYPRKSPQRERMLSTQSGGNSHRDYSPRSRARSPHFPTRPMQQGSANRHVSPRRHTPPHRDCRQRSSPINARDASPQKKREPIGESYGREAHPRTLPDRHRMSPPNPSYSTREKDVYPIASGFRNDSFFDTNERYSSERENVRIHGDLNTPKAKQTSSVFERISSSSREVTLSNKYLDSSTPDNKRKGSSAANRASHVNQHYPENTVSTLRDLSDRPLKRDREEPPPPSTEPPKSWVEEKKAKLRSRVESEEILDMELIILSEKQREYATKVEQRIRHMGVTTSLITLPPSMGVADALDSAVRRNLLYAIIILPQHEQHNSITLTILHGRNPQEHKNMPLEDSLCLINIDHQKYEEAIRDGIIQSRETLSGERTSSQEQQASSPSSTPEKPKLDLEQLSEIVKRFPPTKSELNENSKDLQAKIIGLLGSSAIIPPKTEDNQIPEHTEQRLPLPREPTLALPGLTSPVLPFTPMPRYPPHGMVPHPNMFYSFPPPIPFNFPPGHLSPAPFSPTNPYMHPSKGLPNMLGHPLPFHGRFPPPP